MFNMLRLAAVGSLLFASIGSAQTYYSVDVVNDELCAVNVTNGVVTYLGPLQADLAAVDLAWQQNALYAKTYGSPVGNQIYQIVIDGHFLGYALQGAPLNGGGYQGGEVAGLASNGVSLYLTYSTSNPNDNYSGSFGTVAASWAGLITSAAPTLSPPHDIDAMGFSGGQFWGIDVRAPGTGYRLFSGGQMTGPVTLVGGENLYNPATNPLDVEVFDASWLVAVSQDGQNLVRINRQTGVRGAVTALSGLRPSGALNGIALRPNPCTVRIGASRESRLRSGSLPANSQQGSTRVHLRPQTLVHAGSSVVAAHSHPLAQ